VSFNTPVPLRSRVGCLILGLRASQRLKNYPPTAKIRFCDIVFDIGLANRRYPDIVSV
jgi:hypothetical protein